MTIYREIDSNLLAKAKADRTEFVQSLFDRVLHSKRRGSEKRGK